MTDNSQILLESFRRLEALTMTQIEKIEIQGDEIKWLKESLLHEKQERSAISRHLRELKQENKEQMETIRQQNERIEEQNVTITRQNVEIIRLTTENGNYAEKLAICETTLKEKETMLKTLEKKLEKHDALIEENGMLGAIVKVYEQTQKEEKELREKMEREREERYKKTLCYKIKMWLKKVGDFVMGEGKAEDTAGNGVELNSATNSTKGSRGDVCNAA